MYLWLLLILLVGRANSALETVTDVGVDFHLGIRNQLTVDKTINNVLNHLLSSKSHENFQLAHNFGVYNALHFNASAIGNCIVEEIEQLLDKLGLSGNSSLQLSRSSHLSLAKNFNVKQLIYYEFFAFPSQIIPRAISTVATIREFVKKNDYSGKGYVSWRSESKESSSDKSAGGLTVLELLENSKDYVKGWTEFAFHARSETSSKKVWRKSSKKDSDEKSGKNKLSGKLQEIGKKSGEARKLLKGKGELSGGFGILSGKGGGSESLKGLGKWSGKSGSGSIGGYGKLSGNDGSENSGGFGKLSGQSGSESSGGFEELSGKGKAESSKTSGQLSGNGGSETSGGYGKLSGQGESQSFGGFGELSGKGGSVSSKEFQQLSGKYESENVGGFGKHISETLGGFGKSSEKSASSSGHSEHSAKSEYLQKLEHSGKSDYSGRSEHSAHSKHSGKSEYSSNSKHSGSLGYSGNLKHSSNSEHSGTSDHSSQSKNSGSSKHSHKSDHSGNLNLSGGSKHSANSEHSSGVKHSGSSDNSSGSKHSGKSDSSSNSGSSEEESGQWKNTGKKSKNSEKSSSGQSFDIAKAVVKILQHSPETARKIIKARLSRELPNHPQGQVQRFNEYEALVCHSLTNSESSFCSCLNEIRRVETKIQHRQRSKKTRSNSASYKVQTSAIKLIRKIEVLNNTCKVNNKTNVVDCFIVINASKDSEKSGKDLTTTGENSQNSASNVDISGKNTQDYWGISGNFKNNIETAIIKYPLSFKGDVKLFLRLPEYLIKNSGILSIIHFVENLFGGSFLKIAVSTGFDKYLFGSKSGVKLLNEVASLAYVYREGIKEKQRLEKIFGKEAEERRKIILRSLEEYKVNIIWAGRRAIDDFREIAYSVERSLVKSMSQFMAVDFSQHVKAIKCLHRFIHVILSHWAGHKPANNDHGASHEDSGEDSGEGDSENSSSNSESEEKGNDRYKSVSIATATRSLITSLDRLSHSSVQTRKSSTIATLANTFLLATMFYECITILAAAIYRSEYNENKITATTVHSIFTTSTDGYHSDAWDYDRSQFSKSKSSNQSLLNSERKPSGGGFQEILKNSGISKGFGIAGASGGFTSFVGESENTSND